MDNIKVLGSNVLIATNVEEAKTAGGIVLTGTANKPKDRGVLMCIPEVTFFNKNEITELEPLVGAKVIFDRDKIITDEDEYVIVPSDAIVAVVA